jgi:hypothetical protein
MIWLLKNKTLIIVFVVIGILIAIYFFGKSAGKKKTPKDVALPNAGNGIPVVGKDAKGKPISWSPVPLADEAYDVMDGIFTATGTKETLFIKLLTLTADQLAAVYNEFNRKYYNDSDGTMTKWILDENVDLINSKRPILIEKMRGLGLN